MKPTEYSELRFQIAAPQIAPPQIATSQRKPVPRTFYASFGKRIFDIVLALAILPLITPIILGVWMMARRDGGPGLFVQDRVGLNGTTFKCLKIRSMVHDADRKLTQYLDQNPDAAAEWHINQKLRHDPRITAFGKFIRATSLDELPQVFNILKGEMSFIGPRPFMLNQEALYRQANGTGYYQLRPGISGPWQVSGRGETSFADRADFDNEYYRNLSFRTDMKLVFQTFKVLAQRTGH
ncbi:sugar transferase [Aestuariibius sp. HNIBRBA575]|uniref:sugar transferase n=1 Tax=Aestuariibius sp. HNIBRBA575 TaxID=3233343 RepID=UPI0034A2F8F9